VAVKAPAVCPAATETLPGTVTLELLLDNATLAPPDAAGADNVTVQFADPGELTVPGEQVTEEGTIAIVKVTDADCCWPLSVALTLAVWAPLSEPVVAENVVLV
jgi:hypothetical protein